MILVVPSALANPTDAPVHILQSDMVDSKVCMIVKDDHLIDHDDEDDDGDDKCRTDG
jgi:hypothetical protein